MDFCFYKMVIASLFLAISAYQRFHGNTLFLDTRGKYSGDMRKQAQKRIKVNVPDGNHFMEDKVQGQPEKKDLGSFPSILFTRNSCPSLEILNCSTEKAYKF